jgi:hypothetical protein
MGILSNSLSYPMQLMSRNVELLIKQISYMQLPEIVGNYRMLPLPLPFARIKSKQFVSNHIV